MSTVKTLALSAAVWAAIGTVAHADPISWSNGIFTWKSWGPGPSDSSSPTDSSSTSFTNASAPAAAADPSSSATPISTPPPAPPTQPPSSSSSSGTYDGFINFTSGSYPEASALASGTPGPWYSSPSVEHVFGGVPTQQQQSDFTQQVLQDVQKTFALAGLSPSLTLDPNAHANHTLSVVSGASYSGNSNAIGITDVGANGFGFIDKLSYANSVTDLEWAVAHNVSHELMHAFGVAVHHDQTGNYIDAATASWPLLTNPNATFSPAAAQDILSRDYGRFDGAPTLGAEQIDGDQEILAQPVPEPSTVALYLVAGVIVLHRGRRATRRAA